MSKLIDITGNKYGKLTVIRKDVSINGRMYWECECECGNHTFVSGGNLKTGEVKSCGCLVFNATHSKTHGLSNTKEYKIWSAIKSRCYNSNNKSYADYGGRGIKMCDEWKNSFESFYDWVSKTRDSTEKSIDRIDNDKDYSPENCKWSTHKEQTNNRRICHQFTHNGKTQSLSLWCDELGLDYKRTHNRIFKLGWSFEKSISTPVDVNKRNNKTKELKGKD